MDNKTTLPPVPTQTRRHSRRKSLQGPSPFLSNQGHIAPASPEVISSLITSLSVISTPANKLFEDPTGSQSTPASPAAVQTQFHTPFGQSSLFPKAPEGGSFGIDYGAFDQPSLRELEQQEASIDELPATAPVIRTAKPPSGFSPLTAPKSPSSRDSSPLKSFLRGSSRPGSKSSSLASNDGGSIGNLSIEPGVPPANELRRKSSGDSWGKKQAQARQHKGLMYMSSKERLREREHERKRSSAASVGAKPKGLGLERIPMPKFDADSFMAETAITEEPPTSSEGKGKTPAPTSVSANASPIEAGVSPDLSSSSFPGRAIPPRESSLRKPAAASKKRASQRSSRQSAKGLSSEDVGDVIREADDSQDRRHGRGRRNSKATSTMEGSKMLEPLDNLEMPIPPKATTLASRQVAESAKVDEIKVVDDPEEGAPSPAVAQRKARPSPDGGNRTSYQSQKRRSMVTPEPPHSSQPKRNSSRLKRLSAPLSPRTSESHSRNTSGNPLSRVGSPEPVKPPQIHVDDRPTSADSIGDAVEAYLCSPRLSQKIRHPQTGRIISFSEVGDSEGYAVFCCVGMGLTRYITAFYDELALTLKLRLITADRPGVGDSEPYNDGTATPLSWPGKSDLFSELAFADLCR